jgi:hypothetical protein
MFAHYYLRVLKTGMRIDQTDQIGANTRWGSPENRNQDRSQCKPLHRRNSDLLADSAACICLYPPPPPRKNQSSTMSFWAASHTTYSIIGISLSNDICLQGEGEGE